MRYLRQACSSSGSEDCFVIIGVTSAQFWDSGRVARVKDAADHRPIQATHEMEVNPTEHDILAPLIL